MYRAMAIADAAGAAAAALLPLLPDLLKAYWILAASSVLITLLPIPIPAAFKAAVRLAASRGKLWHDRPAALGPLKDVSVPQQFFEHFYLVGALVTTVALQVYLFVCCEGDSATGGTLQRDAFLALLLFEVHVLRRYAETSYLMHYPDTARMHLLAYLFGLSYYIAVPLTLLPEGVLDFGVLKGAYEQAMGEQRHAHWRSVDTRLYEAATAPHPGLARIVTGVALFLAANALQFTAHLTLGRMAREGSKRAAAVAAAAAAGAGTQGLAAATAAAAVGSAAGLEPVKVPLTALYSVPKGGMFELVSCPHYLAEILIYAAIATVTGGRTGPLLIGTWVLLNLVLAAGATQRWYRTQFPAYPRGRKALVPFIF